MFSYAPGHPNVAATMRAVWIALLPGTATMVWLLGFGVLVNLAAACIFALLAEALMLRIRRVETKPFITDGSAIITAWLLALALPPYVPWWIPAIAATAAIVIGKQIYGGLGNNLFNPAMVGYALTLVAFPTHLTLWPGGEFLTQRFTPTALHHAFSSGNAADMLSGATALAVWRADELPRYADAVLDWQWINLAFLGGGLWLLIRRVILWHIPAAMLATLAASALVANWFAPAAPADTAAPVFHLLSGAAMLGAFFIATDPATAPRSKTAMLLFGTGIGLLLLIFRLHSSYIDGLAFSVLLMNICVPLLDRCFGSASAGAAR